MNYLAHYCCRFIVVVVANKQLLMRLNQTGVYICISRNSSSTKLLQMDRKRNISSQYLPVSGEDPNLDPEM